MSPWRQLAYLDAWIPGLSLAASARLGERDGEKEWLDLADLFCYLLPQQYCYKKSQSIMQREENERKTNTGETKRGKE